MKYSAPRGTRDILPEECADWQLLETACRSVFRSYNYQEIRTPVFESTELFTRSIGGTTDIVKKEMYEFKDRKGRSLTLRPEETAPVVRACLEHNLIGPDKVTKLYYIGPMFRYERPQAGRQRQFHQAGVELFGSADPLADAEVIMLNLHLFQELGLKELAVNLNSVGCRQCRPDFRKELKSYFKDNIQKMCEDCRERFEHNPLRILDCKEARCQPLIEGAPASVDALCPDCRGHFAALVKALDFQQVKFVVNKRLVRGLDYYTRTSFEVISSALGAQNAVSGGGRYDGLVSELGGKATPAVGFAIGLERLLEVMKQGQRGPGSKGPGLDLFIAALGEEARKLAFDLVARVRRKGSSADLDYLDRSLKAQMKLADKLAAARVFIIGEEELNKGHGILKDMRTSEQREVEFDSLEEAVS